MSRIPRNVQLTMRQNEQLQAAKMHAGSLREGNIVAGWHEKDFQKQGANLNSSKLSGPRSISSNPTIAHEVAMQTGVEVVKLARQARLKELYAEETKAYEQELHALGLALVKPRD